MLAGVPAPAHAAPLWNARRYVSAAAQRSLDEWKVRAAYAGDILATSGLLPLPEKDALNPVIFGNVPHQDYIVWEVYLESLPGFLVTGIFIARSATDRFPQSFLLSVIGIRRLETGRGRSLAVPSIWHDRGSSSSLT